MYLLMLPLALLPFVFAKPIDIIQGECSAVRPCYVSPPGCHSTDSCKIVVSIASNVVSIVVNDSPLDRFIALEYDQQKDVSYYFVCVPKRNTIFRATARTGRPIVLAENPVGDRLVYPLEDGIEPKLMCIFSIDQDVMPESSGFMYVTTGSYKDDLIIPKGEQLSYYVTSSLPMQPKIAEESLLKSLNRHAPISGSLDGTNFKNGPSPAVISQKAQFTEKDSENISNYISSIDDMINSVDDDKQKDLVKKEKGKTQHRDVSENKNGRSSDKQQNEKVRPMKKSPVEDFEVDREDEDVKSVNKKGRTSDKSKVVHDDYEEEYPRKQSKKVSRVSEDEYDEFPRKKSSKKTSRFAEDDYAEELPRRKNGKKQFQEDEYDFEEETPRSRKSKGEDDYYEEETNSKNKPSKKSKKNRNRDDDTSDREAWRDDEDEYYDDDSASMVHAFDALLLLPVIVVVANRLI